MAVIFSKGDKLEQNHYTVLQELGLGGMGVVYQCRDEQLMRDVAIKMLLPELMADKASAEVFRQEARLAAQLEHPNIVTVYDIGVEERQKKQHHFVCMEYLPGGNLAHRLETERLEVELCLNWMKQLASGLAFAHKRNVVHQDIKADNIFITNEGDLKIGDFGLARLLVGRVHYDSTVKGMGTPAYMSPELCRGEPQDHRSDIYSLGILFFEMATGHLPFKARGMIEMATKHSSAPIPSARRLNPAIPDVLDKLIRRMMGKLPEERYNSMGEVLTLLDDLIFEMRVKRMGLSTNRPIMRSGPIMPEAVEAVQQQAADRVVINKKVADAAPRDRIFEQTQQVRPTSGGAFQPVAPIGLPAKGANAVTAKTGEPGQGKLTSSQELIAQLEANSRGANKAVGDEKNENTTGGKQANSSANLTANTTQSQIATNAGGQTNSATYLQGSKRPDVAGTKPLGSSNTNSSSGSAYRSAATPPYPIRQGTAAGASNTGTSRPGSSSIGTSSSTSINRQAISGVHKSLQSGTGWTPSLTSLWRYQTKGPIGWSSAPVVDKTETTFYVASADGAIYAIDLATGALKWRHAVGAPVLASPILVGNKLFVADASGQVQSIETGAHEPLWQHKLSSGVVSTPAFFRDMLFVPTEGGRMIALDIFSGTTRWEFKADNAIVCSPHRHAELVLFGTRGGAFHAISAESGRSIWKFHAGEPIVASPAASVDSVYFGTQAGTFFALEADTGGLIWEYPSDKAIVSKALIAFTAVIFCSHDRWLYCCEKYDGSLKWKAPVRGKAIANLVVHKETVLVTTQEGWLQAFQTRTGALLWQIDLSRKLESPPVIAGDYLLQSTVEGEVLALSSKTSDSGEQTA